MANRINISVPDELMEDLNSYKEQIPDKISTICQKALSKTILELKLQKENIEQLKKNPIIIEKIKKLKKEKQELKSAIIELGEKDGNEFLDHISYAELIYISFTLKRFNLIKFEDNSNIPKLLKISTSTYLSKYFNDTDLETFLSNIRNNIFSIHPDYDEEEELAVEIISHYLSKKISQFKHISGVNFVFKNLYIHSFIKVVKNFYDIAGGQILLNDK